MRRSAGRTSPYPTPPSRSPHPPTRPRGPGRWSAAASRARACAGTATLGPGLPQLALPGQLDLILGPRHGALGGHAIDRLGDHVGQDVVDLDQLDCRARLGRPAALVRVLRLFGQHREFRVPRPDGMVGQVLERRVVERVGRHDPGVEVLLLEEELQEVLGELDVLRELPDADRVDRRWRVDAGRAAGAVVIVDLVDDRHFLEEREGVSADGGWYAASLT